MMSLMSSAMQLFGKIGQIESRNKEYLENLAVELVKKEMAIPEGAMQFELRHGQNHSGVSAPPQNGLALAVPRKDALLISLDQAIRR